MQQVSHNPADEQLVPKEGTAQSRYELLSKDRQPYLDKARECAKLTIPHLIRPSDSKGPVINVKTPWQGMGARCTNNLSAKFLMALLPPNNPFFRLKVDELLEKQLEDETNKDVSTELEKGLSSFERGVMSEIETSGDRVVIHEAMKHLIVTGNILLHNDKEGIRAFHLDKFVCLRDPSGNPIEIIATESVAPSALGPEFLNQIKTLPDYAAAARDQKDADRSLDIYTWLRREGDFWNVHQECYGKTIPTTEGKYKVEECDWIVLRFNRIDGESYGRSHVEDFLGDLKALNMLYRALVKGSAAAARVIGLVNPGSTTQVDALNDADDGEFVAGIIDDVGFLQMDKLNDFRIAEMMIQRLEQRLAQAFLLTQSVQRDAERVTAEEIRLMAAELEDALGGTYAILTQEFQLPYVKSKIAQLNTAGKLPKMDEKFVKPTIVTGLEALGRGHDRNKLLMFLETGKAVFGEQAMMMLINPLEGLSRLATSDGIDSQGLVKTQAELDAEKKQQMEIAQQDKIIEMINKLGPQGINQAGNLAKAGMEQQAPPQAVPPQE